MENIFDNISFIKNERVGSFLTVRFDNCNMNLCINYLNVQLRIAQNYGEQSFACFEKIKEYNEVNFYLNKFREASALDEAKCLEYAYLASVKLDQIEELRNEFENTTASVLGACRAIKDGITSFEEKTDEAHKAIFEPENKLRYEEYRKLDLHFLKVFNPKINKIIDLARLEYMKVKSMKKELATLFNENRIIEK